MKLIILVAAAAATACGATNPAPPEQRAPAPTPADAGAEATARFAVVGTVMVGEAPHGIAFDEDGTAAYVAVTGDDQVAVIDLASLRVTRRMAAGSAPVGVAVAGDRLYVTQFGSDEIVELGGPDATLGRRVRVGEGPSLFAPRTAGEHLVVAAERAAVLAVFDPASGRVAARHAAGAGPRPPDVTRDGRLAVIPNPGEGTITFLDLARGTRDVLRVCREPHGGALTPDDASYVVACGEGIVVRVDVAARRVTWARGHAGARPFAVAVLGDGRHAVVTDAGGDEVAIVELAGPGGVAERVRVGTRPIVARVHPDGRRVLVASEISGTVTVLAPVD